MAAKLDAQFANSAAETKTSTEKAFLQGFVNQIGDVGAIMVAILVAVLFSILLVAANTMAQAVRERTSELAVLKTLGFSNGLVLDAGARRVALHGAARRRARASALAWMLHQPRQLEQRVPARLRACEAATSRSASRSAACWACSRERCRPSSAMRLRITDALRRN